MPTTERESEAIVLVKAASQTGRSYGEAVCCAGVTPQGEWVRLYPVTFRKQADILRFGRWSRIRFAWHASPDDQRPESRRIDPNSVEIIGALAQSQRHDFLSGIEVKGLRGLKAQRKSLALLRPRRPHFFTERKTEQEIAEEQKAYELVIRQEGALDSKTLMPPRPCPYKFKYRYTLDDGEYEGTYQDWGIHTTFFNLSRSYGEEKTLARIAQMFGKEYPDKGMVFAVGAETSDPDHWRIDAIIRMDEIYHMTGDCCDMVV